METLKEMAERRKTMTPQEQMDEVINAIYQNIDDYLDSMFMERTMAIRSVVDDMKEEAARKIDEYITAKGRELMDKYDNMSDTELAAHAFKEIFSSGMGDDFMADLLGDHK